jgi:predicted nucleic acid-binding protein
VVNSSPLIALVAALPDFNLLSSLVERFIVPAEVLAELVAGGLKDDTASRVQAASWCEVRPSSVSTSDPLVHRLGAGEAAVIQTALNESLSLVVIDEVRGRRAARLAGLRVIGSLGLLLELHHAGLLPSIEDSIQRMQAKGIWLAPNIVSATLQAAREQRA